MAWKNYPYLRFVRGISNREFRVLSYLVDEGGQNGAVEALQAKTIAIECEMARNTVFLILKQLQDKGFIMTRKNNYKLPSREQISNSYQLNFNQYFPQDDKKGGKLWKSIIEELSGAAPEYAENSCAYYTGKTKNLTVWLDGGTRELNYFQKFRLKELLSIGRSQSDKIRYFDFIIKVPSRTQI